MKYPKQFARFLSLVNTTIYRMNRTNLIYCEGSVVIEVGTKVERTRWSNNKIRGYIEWNEERQCCEVRTRTSIGTRW